ncbi:uncharacterized protein F5147DRAFT_433836 [Suillus discolor]|uniref:Uncharacterized protein n=1 Tax=Suillus discolor TaxID=1912936 RepID=A0A9P7JN25_9AGAM|nr:uncharacterized protein F5147DRAFT_433836 [Suillus discolor]KAG2092510.1 hypothetical protein F5147DRAFT_433836 [Suillus discolor]
MIIKYGFSPHPPVYAPHLCLLLCARSVAVTLLSDLVRTLLAVCRTRFVDSRKCTSTRLDTPLFIVACSVLACIMLFYWSPLCSFRATRTYPFQLHPRITVIVLPALFTTITRTYFPYTVVSSDAFLITCFLLEFVEW